MADLELREITKALVKSASCYGGTPEAGHGWEPCKFCYGWPDHKKDCVLSRAKQALRRTEPARVERRGHG